MRDTSLIRKLKLKEEKTFAKFFDQYKNLVFYECNMILNNRVEAEDVAQEVFIEFFNRIDELKEDTNLKLYIAALAKRRAIDAYRKKSKSNISYLEDIETFGQKDNSINLLSLLSNLLEKEEEVIINLKIIYEFSFAEIAQDLNMSLGKVQGIYYQAVKKLKKHYKKGS